MIEIADYDESWPNRFASVRRRLLDALSHVPILAIEHVGSTSVPGLCAKPIIDCDVVVEADAVPKATTALESIGFRPLGTLGIPERYAFTAPADLGATNVYVVVNESLALRNHIGVREVLRAQPQLRDDYGQAKRLAAASATDIDDYVERKTPVLQRVLRAAGLTDAELTSIEEHNTKPR